MSADFRIGQGFDVHAFAEGRKLVLGGVEIPHDRGLAGHSDADALLHAVTDALLGALGEGDLGRHFPSSDPQWKGADSSRLLASVMATARARGLAVRHVDATIVAQEPRLSPHQPAMRARLAEALGLPEDRVNLKVTSTDHLGAIGRGEGIACLAVALVSPEEA